MSLSDFNRGEHACTAGRGEHACTADQWGVVGRGIVGAPALMRQHLQPVDPYDRAAESAFKVQKDLVIAPHPA
jgi:hypothetical protein